ERRLGIACSLVEEFVSVEGAVPHKLEYCAMELVGAAARRDIDHTAGEPAPLGRQAVALHFEFLRRIHGGYGRHLVDEAAGARDAVDQDLIGLRPPPVDRHPAFAPGVDRYVAKLA